MSDSAAVAVRFVPLALALSSGLMPAPTRAADIFYLGSWQFTDAVLAPWHDPKRGADTKERARLMGKTIVLKDKDIDGPQPFPCKGPSYKLTDYTSDLLFQGAFDEMRQHDKSVDPDKIAVSLGFKAGKIKTLETGCEFDIHFVDDKTAEVGLNDYVYTLKKQ
jgi:hypothetical protein